MTQVGVTTTAEPTGRVEALDDRDRGAGHPFDGSTPDGGRASLVRRVRRGTVIVLAVVAVTVPLALAAARWPSWWSWIAAEDTPMTWLQSVTLLVTGVLSALAAYATALGLPGGRAHGVPDTGRASRWSGWLSGRPALAWSLLAVGFTALAFDERFAIHERVRDRILAPRDIRLPFLPWVGPGDFLMLLVAIAGLLALPALWRLFSRDRLARTLLLVAVALAATAVAMDSVSADLMSIEVERLEQTVEECLEFAAGLGLLAAVATRLQALLAG